MKPRQNFGSDTITRGTWLVELRGDKNFQGELLDNFSFREGREGKALPFFLEQVYGQIFLHSQTFPQLPDPRQVQHEGERLLCLMNGILKVQVPARANDMIELGGVFVEETPFRMRGSVFDGCAEHISPHKSHPNESGKLLELASIDTSVETVLQLYGSRDPLWRTLGKMMEMINGDMLAFQEEEGLPSRETLNHFQSTVQHHAFGETLTPSFLPKQKNVREIPMPLIEARLVIHTLLVSWLSWKFNHICQEVVLSIGV